MTSTSYSNEGHLTAQAIDLVKTSYNVIAKDKKAVGMELLIKLFNKKPEYQGYFTFKDIPLKDLPSSPRFQAHAVIIMNALTSIIENLENSEVAGILLQTLGVSHAKRGLSEEHFNVFKQIFLELIETLDKETVDAWNNTLTFALRVIVDTMKKSQT